MHKYLCSLFLIFISSQGFSTFDDIGDIVRNPIFLEEVAEYLVGDSWNKHPIAESAIDLNPKLGKLKGVSRINSGTTFYLGKRAGHHVFATNYHVCPNEERCKKGTQIYSPVVSSPMYLESFIGSWTKIDFAIYTVAMTADQEEIMKNYAFDFDFDLQMKVGTRLATAGYGFVANPLNLLTMTADQDCVLFSEEIRFFGDPDEHNTGDYSSWSFAHGCDVSHGDSGSPFLDYNSGKLIGLLWTGRVPKSSEVQNSASLKNVLNTGDEEIIWHHLNYSVPASKIRQVLASIELESSDQLIINAIIKK